MGVVSGDRFSRFQEFQKEFQEVTGPLRRFRGFQELERSWNRDLNGVSGGRWFTEVSGRFIGSPEVSGAGGGWVLMFQGRFRGGGCCWFHECPMGIQGVSGDLQGSRRSAMRSQGVIHGV